MRGISDRIRDATIDLATVSAGLAHNPVESLRKTAEADTLLELRRRLVMMAGTMTAGGGAAN